MKALYYLIFLFQLLSSQALEREDALFLNSTNIPTILPSTNSTISHVLYNDTFPSANITSSLSSLTSKSNSQTPISCYYDTDCWRYAGQNSRCYSGLCICDLGYVATPTFCQPLTCTSDSVCWSRWTGTRCWSLRCSCDYGYQLEQSSQTCRYVYRPPNGSVGQSVLEYNLVLFVVVAIAIAIEYLC